METHRLPHRLPLYSKFKAWGFKPLVVDFYVQRVWPTFSLERILARVRSVRPAASGVVTISLKPNFNFRNFKAGQHVLLTTTVNGHRITRTYSPTRLTDNSLEITVKNIAGGKVSSSLAQNLKRGDAVEISEPFGDMTWEKVPTSKNYVFCAGGVGITPLRSLIHAWSESSELNQSRSIELHYWAKTESEHCFKSELQRIASRLPGLKLHFYSSQTDAQKTSLSTAILKANFQSIGSAIGSVVVACGPQSFVQNAEAIAQSNALPFFGEHAHAAQATETDSTIEETFFEINYGGQVIQASSKKSILESLEAQGFEPAHGCRMGLCKSCTCMKKSGTTISAKDQSLSTEQNEEIQICVASPRSPITLERY